ncbi:hypothetical protein [Ottowia caeni]|uniref:hypothetical protein n=1 Tax=Ottowia caeni TaxID=2870339 RepID=UPI001E4A781D|nr:hypothetical protein [Ottowia caeni]
MARDDFTKPTKNQAYQRVAGRCSNPACRATTSAPVGNDDFSNVGVGAHIHAASPGGPRYLAAMTADDRRGFGNIIWLCQTCSTIIDRDPDAYPAETLKKWKSSAEASALMEQGKRLPDQKDIYRMAAMAMGNRTPGFYPEAIGNVHKALVDQMEAVDPRFTVSTAYSGGNTTITLSARETVSFSIKVGSESAEAWRKGLQAAIDDGREATLPLDGVVFEGSKLFDVLHNDADLASITIMPAARPAVLKIFAPQTAPAIFESVAGQLTAGRKQIRFSGSGCGGLLDVEIIYSQTSGDGVHSRLTLTTNLKAWQGKEAANPPYLDALTNLLEAILDPSAAISFAMEVDGNHAAAGKFQNPKHIEEIAETLVFTHYVRRARNVLRYLGQSPPIDIFASISADDYRALARVSDIVEGKLSYQRSQITASPTMRIACADGGESLMRIVRKGEFSTLQLKEPASLVTIYGKEYEVPPTTSYYSPVKLHILSRKKKKEVIDFRLQIEMADNFTSQTFFDVQH